MMDTSVSLSADQQSRLVPGHARGKLAASWDIVSLAGCGGLRSTGDDMLRFLRAQVNPHPAPLQDAIRMSQQPHIGNGSKAKWIAQCAQYLLIIGSWHLLDHLIDRWIPGLSMWSRIALIGTIMLFAIFGAYLTLWRLRPSLLSPPRRIGLGWHVDRLAGKQDFIWHNGGTGGYRSYMAVVPDERAGVVVLSNCDISVDAIGKSALTAIVRVDTNRGEGEPRTRLPPQP